MSVIEFLHGKVTGWIGQILQEEQPATQGTWAPLVSSLGRQSLVANQIDILDLLNLFHQYGLAQQEARHGIAWAATFTRGSSLGQDVASCTVKQ